jgi:GT2 family glycosyltransferase
LKAAQHTSVEILVIDNNSVDGSEEMMKDKFPTIPYIMNKENLGFSRANNQGMRIAQGEYVLLLNPDTVVEEMTFRSTVDFMNAHPDAGGLGVRMLDGRGKFLPESKRGLPTPSVAFYKIFGLSTLFPKSKVFGKYHLGYLSEFETHEVEILSGAFMLMRKSVLDKIGLLDEAFFMYGEDIDLSYRIVQSGFKNYYFPGTRIIHYKGESTKKSSVNYVFVFYRAMIIFANKHFSQNNAKLFSALINSAVYFRASLSIFKRVVSKYFIIALDFAVVTTFLLAILKLFELFGKFVPKEILLFALPSYSLIWLIAIYFYGGYDRPTSWIRILQGLFFGTIAILTIYALLPKAYQFSRLFILFGSLAAFIYFVVSRFILHFFRPATGFLNSKKESAKIVIGSSEESSRVSEILQVMDLNSSRILFVSVGETKEANAVGTLGQLEEIVSVHKADEVIFCARDISAEQIISWMSRISYLEIAFKIAQPESSFIIGSNSIDHPGELYLMNITAISEPRHIRAKRVFDFIFSMIFILIFPLGLLLILKNKKRILDLFLVLFGKMTFVGFAESVNSVRNLPKLKRGIFSTTDQIESYLQLSPNEIQKINLIYAKDYTWFKDLSIFIKKVI